MSSAFESLFFFYSSSAHRDLHSFPTRRSSDLAHRQDDRQAPRRRGWSRAAAGAVGVRDQPRSEEHTSELQSHVNLVCRLLLEKKKYTVISVLYCTKPNVYAPSMRQLAATRTSI